MTTTPMTLIGTQGERLLAGRTEVTIEAGTVIVLTKESATTFMLRSVDTSKPDQLASFISADQAEANSLLHAVLSVTKPTKPRRRRVKK